MLKLLRKKKVAKRIYYVLAAIIIPAFIVWGSASVMKEKDKAPAYAGLIFNKKVSFDDFRSALDAWRNQMKLQYGDKTNEIIDTYLNPFQATWDRLIMLAEVKRRRIAVSDSEVIAAVTRLPFLQRNGRFDPQAYQYFLRYDLGVNPRVFEEQLRENLSMSKVFGQETQHVAVSDQDVRLAYERANVMMRVRYVAFPFAAYKEGLTITEAEIKNYFDTAKDRLRVPPQINAVYIGIESEEKMTPAQRTEAEQKIQKVVGLTKEKGFAGAAKETDLPLKETGLFGFEDPIPGFGWLPQLSSLLFDLPPNATSKIVETSHGFFLFQIKEKKDAYVPDLKEAHDKIKSILSEEKSKEIARQKARAVLDKIRSQGLSFEAAVKDTGSPVKETPDFSRESYIEELGMAEPLKEAAFKLRKDEVAGDVISLEQAAYVIQAIDTPALDEEKFKKEKDDFRLQVLAQKQNEAFNVFFERLRKQARLTSYITEGNIR